MQKFDEMRAALENSGFDEKQAKALAGVILTLMHGSGRLQSQRIIMHLWGMACIICVCVWYLVGGRG